MSPLERRHRPLFGSGVISEDVRGKGLHFVPTVPGAPNMTAVAAPVERALTVHNAGSLSPSYENSGQADPTTELLSRDSSCWAAQHTAWPAATLCVRRTRDAQPWR